MLPENNTINVNNDKDMPLSEKVAKEIMLLIKERDLKPGDKLPNEFELADSLNVGRGTIREAVKLLVAKNHLEIRRGKGTFVTADSGKNEDPLGFEFVEDQVTLAEELYELRLRIEPWIASLAAKRITEDEKEELKLRCEAVENDILAGVDHCDSDVAFHQYIAKCTHNSVLPEIIPIITYSVQLLTKDKNPKMLTRTIHTHKAVVDSICANDAEMAKQHMHEHIERNIDSIIAVKEFIK